jgi:hypothetical protein
VLQICCKVDFAAPGPLVGVFAEVLLLRINARSPVRASNVRAASITAFDQRVGQQRWPAGGVGSCRFAFTFCRGFAFRREAGVRMLGAAA